MVAIILRSRTLDCAPAFFIYYMYHLDNAVDFKPHTFELKQEILRFFCQPNNYKKKFEIEAPANFESLAPMCPIEPIWTQLGHLWPAFLVCA